jgi:flagellar biosynthetic protein FlhB
MSQKDQRTEQPTQRRLEKARKEGQFPVSREFVSSVQFTIFVALVVAYAPGWFDQAKAVLAHITAYAFQPNLSLQTWIALLYGLATPVAQPLLMLGAALAISSLMVQLGTTRFGFATSRLALDLQRLDPFKRIAQLPQQNIPQLAQALILLPLFSLAVWAVASENLEIYLRLPLAGIEAGTARVAQSIRDLLWRAAGLFLLFGCIDYVRQRRRWMSELRMSRQDIRDEMKESEGDPQIKARIRRVGRDLLRRKMMREVDTATAVVVNPTHFAVAIRYLPAEMPAPKIVAKGKNYLALRIRERALNHQVPIVENPPLARALYKSAEIGQEIPAHLYRAVAEVLAYLYRLAGGRPGGPR